MKKIILLIILLISFQLNAIEISGIVSEKLLGTNLEGAIIILKGKQKFAKTDKDGKFNIDAEIGDFLIIMKKEFKNKEFEIKENSLNIEL